MGEKVTPVAKSVCHDEVHANAVHTCVGPCMWLDFYADGVPAWSANVHPNIHWSAADRFMLITMLRSEVLHLIPLKSRHVFMNNQGDAPFEAIHHVDAQKDRIFRFILL